jgi:hypothetical protein
MPPRVHRAGSIIRRGGNYVPSEFAPYDALFPKKRGAIKSVKYDFWTRPLTLAAPFAAAAASIAFYFFPLNQ